MKKKILIGLFAIAAFSLSSCKKETIVNNYTVAYSAVYTIHTGDWTTANSSLSYSATLVVPELDNAILDAGGVEVYLSFDNGATYETVPEVFNGIAYGSVHSYQTVVVDLQSATGSGTISAPGSTILAKVVLVDATPL